MITSISEQKENQWRDDSDLISVGCHGVSTERGSDRVIIIRDSDFANNLDPVATALGY